MPSSSSGDSGSGIREVMRGLQGRRGQDYSVDPDDADGPATGVAGRWLQSWAAVVARAYAGRGAAARMHEPADSVGRGPAGLVDEAGRLRLQDAGGLLHGGVLQ